jgi:hypothetical protein
MGWDSHVRGWREFNINCVGCLTPFSTCFIKTLNGRIAVNDELGKWKRKGRGKLKNFLLSKKNHETLQSRHKFAFIFGGNVAAFNGQE